MPRERVVDNPEGWQQLGKRLSEAILVLAGDLQLTGATNSVLLLLALLWKSRLPELRKRRAY